MAVADIIAFSVVASTTLAFAVGVVAARKLFYAALFLAGSLIGVAMTFLLLGAEFLFVVQILVYVGAVTTLILFAIMFTEGGSTAEEVEK